MSSRTLVLLSVCVCALIPCCSESTSPPQNDNPPTSPELESPANLVIIDGRAVELRWASSDPDGGKLLFDVYFGVADVPARLTTHQVENYLRVTDLSYGTTYRWKIVAWDDESDSSASAIWEFTTAAQPYWSAYGTSMDEPSVLTINEYNGQVIAGGMLYTISGQPVNHLVSWNGSTWQPFGTGISKPEDLFVWVNASAIYQNRLVIGGRFEMVDVIAARYVAAWGGVDWSGLNSELNDPVNALLVVDGLLYAGSSFRTNNGIETSGVLTWDGSTWTRIGSGLRNGFVSAMAEYNGNIVIGGRLSTGSFNSTNIAQLSGGRWITVGSGLNDDVDALCVYQGQLIAGGNFTAAGAVSLSRVAAWNGSSWSPLGEGLNGRLMALLVYEDILIAGGEFTAAGGEPANYLATWDGQSWSTLGVGTNNFVRCLAEIDGRLMIGGDFTMAGGLPAHGVVSWGN